MKLLFIITVTAFLGIMAIDSIFLHKEKEFKGELVSAQIGTSGKEQIPEYSSKDSKAVIVIYPEEKTEFIFPRVYIPSPPPHFPMNHAVSEN